MKLLRIGSVGQEVPAILDAAGTLRDARSWVGDWQGAALDPARLAELASRDASALPRIGRSARIGCPVAGVGKFIGIGLNYADHAAEAGMPIPKEPVVFMKTTSCIVGPNDDVPLPTLQGKLSAKTDWEAELGVVIGRTAKHVSEADALGFVAGYCVVNDVSEREYQLERGPTWDRGKGCDGFGPVGPWLVTADEVPNPQALQVWLDLNGHPAQRGSTATMIFGVAQLVSYLSDLFTLHPGDIITTGTPPGVGMGMKPAPRYLRRGDVMTLGITGLGVQRQAVI